MRRYGLVDLYVPVSFGTPAEVADAATNSGLHAVIYVAQMEEECPDPDEIAEVNAQGGATIIPAISLMSTGGRLLVITPECEPSTYELLDTVGDLGLLQDAVTEMGGTLVAVAPYLDADGEVSRHMQAIPDRMETGVVSMVVAGRHLARQLEIEDAAILGRRILGATGPFGSLDRLGRFATFLPTDEGVEGIIASLNRGEGVSIELWTPKRRTQSSDKRRRRRPRRGRKRSD